MKRNTIDIITLGCSKNLVDSEKLMRQLEANGYKVTHDSDKPQGEIAVINTCGFIGDAKEESINMILEFCQAKEEGKKLTALLSGEPIPGIAAAGTDYMEQEEIENEE